MRIKNFFSKHLPKNKYLDILPYFTQEKTKNFTTLIFTLLAVSFFGFFAIHPTLSTIAQLKRQLTDSQFVNQKLQEKISALSELQKQYTELQEDIPDVFSAIPQTPSTPLLTGQLQLLALDSDISILRLQIFEVELYQGQQEKNSSFAFSLEAQGEQDKLLNFLSSLVNFERIVTIDTLSFTKVETEGTFNLSLRGKAYFKP